MRIPFFLVLSMKAVVAGVENIFLGLIMNQALFKSFRYVDLSNFHHNSLR